MYSRSWEKISQIYSDFVSKSYQIYSSFERKFLKFTPILGINVSKFTPILGVNLANVLQSWEKISQIYSDFVSKFIKFTLILRQYIFQICSDLACTLETSIWDELSNSELAEKWGEEQNQSQNLAALCFFLFLLLKINFNEIHVRTNNIYIVDYLYVNIIVLYTLQNVFFTLTPIFRNTPLLLSPLRAAPGFISDIFIFIYLYTFDCLMFILQKNHDSRCVVNMFYHHDTLIVMINLLK